MFDIHCDLKKNTNLIDFADYDFLVVYKILIVVLSLIDLNLNVIIQKILKFTVELAILMTLVILKNWIFFITSCIILNI